MDTARVIPVEYREETVEVYLEYVKTVEQEFSEHAGEILEILNLSHLRKPREVSE